jgi:hypothetical protein
MSMSKEYLQKLVASEQHLKHVALELAAEHLEDNAEDIIGATLYTYDYDPEKDPEEYAEQEQAVEWYELFAEPLTKGVKKLAKELKNQAAEQAKTCICYWPDDERVYPAVSELLHQLPLPFDSAFIREDDEGYRLTMNDQVIFRHLDGDAAIEATRQYVSARTMNPDLPTHTTDELN